MAVQGAVCRAYTLIDTRGFLLRTESCLTRWMERAGIKDSKAQEYENKLAKVGVSKQMLLDTSPIILAFLTKANLLEIQGLQQCVGKASQWK